MVHSGYHHLRQLRAVMSSLTPAASSALAHTLINIRLYYCNSLFIASSENATASLISGAGWFDNISPILCAPHNCPCEGHHENIRLLLVCLHGKIPEILTQATEFIARCVCNVKKLYVHAGSVFCLWRSISFLRKCE